MMLFKNRGTPAQVLRRQTVQSSEAPSAPPARYHVSAMDSIAATSRPTVRMCHAWWCKTSSSSGPLPRRGSSQGPRPLPGGARRVRGAPPDGAVAACTGQK
jgi:hypothetical protein